MAESFIVTESNDASIQWQEENCLLKVSCVESSVGCRHIGEYEDGYRASMQVMLHKNVAEKNILNKADNNALDNSSTEISKQQSTKKNYGPKQLQ